MFPLPPIHTKKMPPDADSYPRPPKFEYDGYGEHPLNHYWIFAKERKMTHFCDMINREAWTDEELKKTFENNSRRCANKMQKIEDERVVMAHRCPNANEKLDNIYTRQQELVANATRYTEILYECWVEVKAEVISMGQAR